MTIVVVRLLHPADYGLVALATLVTTTIGLLMDAGLGPSLIQHGSMSQSVYRSANGILLAAGVIAAVAVCASSGAISRYFSQPQLRPILYVISLQFVLSGMSVAPHAQLSISMRFRDLALVQAVSGLSQGIVTLVLAISGAAFWSLIVGTICGSAVRLLILIVRADLPYRIGFSVSPLRRYWAQSKYVVSSRIAWTIADQADQFIVGRWLGASTLGFFSIAKNLSNMPLDRVSEIVNQVSLPAFSRIQGDTERWRLGFEKLMRVSAILSFPLFWGMAAVAPTALPMLLGPKWTAATPAFVLLSLPLPLRTAQSLWGSALFARRRADLAFYTVAIWAAVMVPALAAGSRAGLNGVAAAWAISYPIVFLVCSVLIAKALKESLLLLLNPLAAPLCAALLSSGTAAALPYIAPLPYAPLELGLQIAAGFVIYLGTFTLIARKQSVEMWSLIRQFARR